MVDNITQKHLNVHSVTVIRHGYVVLDSYFYPYRPTATHDVASVTKSITAAIIGIAVDKGLVKTDQSLLSFFPDERPGASGLRHTGCTLTRVLRARFTFSRMSEADAVQMKGLGRWL
jgi:CubicO group peptidase (beta-lactamase class C family)